MSEQKNYSTALYSLVTVFFFWGFVAASNDILIPVFKKAFDLTQGQSQFVSIAFYISYTVGSLIYMGVSLLLGKDLVACAQTGTGKTAAFTLPIIQLMDAKQTFQKPKKIRALIVTPTRELAIQIGESFKAYARHTSLNYTVIFGGVGQSPQVSALRSGVDVVIATPGRLLDLMNQKLLSIANVEYFVLDEADRMLDMGFIHDVRKLLAALPRQRQSLFFSATMPPEIVQLAASILRNPAEVSVTPVSSTVEIINQSTSQPNVSSFSVKKHVTIYNNRLADDSKIKRGGEYNLLYDASINFLCPTRCDIRG